MTDPTPVPSMEQIRELIAWSYENSLHSFYDNYSNIHAALTHYAALRAALDVEALDDGAKALEAEANKMDPTKFSMWPEILHTHAAALRHLISIAEGA